VLYIGIIWGVRSCPAWFAHVFPATVREMVERMLLVIQLSVPCRLCSCWNSGAQTETHRQDACASATWSVGCANWI